MAFAAMVRPHRRRVVCLAFVAGTAARSSLAAAEPAPVPALAPPEIARVQRSPGAMIGGSIGFGSQTALALDLRVGALVHPHVALFGDAMAMATVGSGDRFLGGGVRVSSDWWFVDARLGQVRRSFSCDFDEPCTSITAAAGILGAGLEVLHGAHAGLELHVDLIRAFHNTTVETGLGVSFYL
jgi:hypothetical protein